MSAIHSVQINVNQASAESQLSRQQAPDKTNEASAKQEELGAVYEKSSQNANEKVIADTKDGKVIEKKDTDRSAIIKQLQDETEKQKQQLLDIVRKSMTGQASTAATALAKPGEDDEDSIWAQFADGKVTVTEAAKAQAQEDISEDGYWGVEKTSDRIVDFAKTLSGNDPSKAQMLMDAFKKGYDQATKSWGRELPDISKKTFDAVNEKMKKWMDEGKTSGATDTSKAAENTAKTTDTQKAAQTARENANKAAQTQQAAETAAQNTGAA